MAHVEFGWAHCGVKLNGDRVGCDKSKGFSTLPCSCECPPCCDYGRREYLDAPDPASALPLVDLAVSESVVPHHDPVAHPSHYTDGKIEVLDFIIDKGFGEGFCLGNAIKYIARAGKKDPSKYEEDLRKAKEYIDLWLTRRPKSELPF